MSLKLCLYASFAEAIVGDEGRCGRDEGGGLKVREGGCGWVGEAG